MTKVSDIDRSKLMKRAAAARAKGRHKKAIALYRTLLEREPDNADLHKKLAPLYAKTRQAPEALASYQIAAEGLVRQGFNDQAVGLLRGAAAELPTEAIVWQSVAELEVQRGRKADAIQTLLEGRRHMRRRRQRPQAIALLSKARRIDPGHFEVSYDLAGLFATTGRRAMALRLLDELAAKADARHLLRVRARQLRHAPGPGSLWRYLRALVMRR